MFLWVEVGSSLAAECCLVTRSSLKLSGTCLVALAITHESRTSTLQVGYMKDLARMMMHFSLLVQWPYFLLCCCLVSTS
ncbi:hypothetical protein OS493_023002 [Desmophyllum pertusum]|uniref:Uncharacterized protein n=1 Tax=Desmophyllum pertusum TaxID=174260 RepID=A0A9W9ZB73_9CNID|nr:hypothetical protein OS493_023002 [Desmophyllum pertusum]